MARLVITTPADPIRSLAERARLEGVVALLGECLGQAVAQAREEPA